jgi:2-dehydropantoate 2-reductase
MRHVIYGAGAIGGVLGARLHQAGHDVALISRGAHFQAIRDNGLRLQWADGDETLKIPAVDHPSKVSWRDEDVVYLATKSQDTQSALFALRAAAPVEAKVVSLQNGVGNEAAALRFFANVYGVYVQCPASHLEPGIVQAYSTPVTGLLDVGRFPTGVDDIAREISATFNASTYLSESRADILRWKYGKLLMNLGNGIDAMCGSAARGTNLVELARAEGVSVLDAAGIDYVNPEEDLARRGTRMTMLPIQGRQREGGSTWQSLARGLGTVETDYLNGEITKLGRWFGIPTPVNELLQRMTALCAREGVKPGSVDVQSLLAQL